MPASSQDRSSDELSLEMLELLRRNSPAWRLLITPRAPFIAAFLHRTFLQTNKHEIAEQQMLANLESYIALLNEGQMAAWYESAGPNNPDGPDRTAGPDDLASSADPQANQSLITRPAREYLLEWADDSHGWLRRFYPAGKEEPYYDLSAQAQKALEWLVELRPQSFQAFIGTESRMLTVFDILRQIVEGTEQDPEQRIAALERQKKEIDDEIERVRTGQATLLDRTQVRERFAQAITLARQILADFRGVEQNFRDLDRRMRVKVSQWDQGKGALLEQVFEDQDSIADSEQGRSFAAFWRFLMMPEISGSFEENLEAVLAMEPITEMDLPAGVREIKGDWITAGAHVQGTVALLDAQLRRYIDDAYLAEERRILELVREIESKALRLADQPPKNWRYSVDALKPRLNMTLDRPLWRHRERLVTGDIILTSAEELDELDALFEQVYVDKDLLRERIERSLQTADFVTLSELLVRYPLERGLSELVAYLTLAGSSDWLEEADGEEGGSVGEAGSGEGGEEGTREAAPAPTAIYSWTDDTGKQRAVRMEEVVFSRRQAGAYPHKKADLAGETVNA